MVGKSVDMFGHPVCVMTPLTEQTESGFDSTRMHGFDTIHESDIEHDLDSTNFSARNMTVDSIQSDVGFLETNGPCDPSTPTIRFKILKRHTIPPNANLDINMALKTSIIREKVLQLPNRTLSIQQEFDSESRVFLCGNVVKVYDFPTVWEFYIMYRLGSLLPQSYRYCVPRVLTGGMFATESFVEMTYHPRQLPLKVGNSH